MRLALVGRELVSWNELLVGLILLRILLPNPTRLLPKRPGLLPLILLIRLPRGHSELRVGIGLPVVRSAQQHVGQVQHRVVDEDPLVVGLLLVEDSDRRVFTLARDTYDRSSTEGLPADTRVAEDGVVAPGPPRGVRILFTCSAGAWSDSRAGAEPRLSLRATCSARIWRSSATRLRCDLRQNPDNSTLLLFWRQLLRHTRRRVRGLIGTRTPWCPTQVRVGHARRTKLLARSSLWDAQRVRSQQ